MAGTPCGCLPTCRDAPARSMQCLGQHKRTCPPARPAWHRGPWFPYQMQIVPRRSCPQRVVSILARLGPNGTPRCPRRRNRARTQQRVPPPRRHRTCSIGPRHRRPFRRRQRTLGRQKAWRWQPMGPGLKRRQAAAAPTFETPVLPGLGTTARRWASAVSWQENLPQSQCPERWWQAGVRGTLGPGSPPPFPSSSP